MAASELGGHVNRSRTACLLVLTAGLLAGCGGGSDSDNTEEAAPPPPPIAGIATTEAPAADPTAAPTSSTAALLATAGVLSAAELPGFEGDPVGRDDSAEQDEMALYQCLQATRPAHVHRDTGMVWAKDSQEILSSADVLPSAAVAQSDLAAAKAGQANCFGTYFVTLYGDADGNPTVTAEQVPVTVKDADGAFAVRVTLTDNLPDDPLNVTGFMVGAYVDTVRIDVVSVAFNSTAPQLSDAVDAAGAAATRVRAASRG